MHPHPGRQAQRLLWPIGDAYRRSAVVIAGRLAGAEVAGTPIPAAGASFAPALGAPAGAGAPHLDLSLAVHGGRAHLSLVGELDGFTAPEVLRRVRALVEGGARSVVVDLGGTEVIDSHGLAALVSASTLLDQHKGEMVLKSPRSATLKLLNLAGLGNRFVIC